MKLLNFTPRKRQPTESEKKIQELFDEHDAIWKDVPVIEPVKKSNGDAGITQVFCGVKKKNNEVKA